MTKRRNRASGNSRNLVGAGADFLASVLHHRTVSALRDVTEPETMFRSPADREPTTEERVYNFIRRHHDEYQTLPTRAIIRDNMGLTLPKVDSAQPPSYYLRRLRERAMYRHVMPSYNRLQEAMQNPRTATSMLDEAIDELYVIRNRLLNAGTGIELSTSIIEEVQRLSREASLSGGLLRGITTGYSELDATMDGYNAEDLVVWVGRPGRGKSWFLLKQAHAAWTAGYKPLYVSMEMGAVQNMRRILGIHTRVNPTRIKRGHIGTPARALFDAKLNELLELRPLHMVTANFSRTVDQIANFVEEHTPDIVFIDAGYLLSPRKKRYGSSGRRETISDVIEELKELAANAGIPFVITVQFNRNAEQRRRGSDTRRREGENSDYNPISHLSLAEIGETDVIGQAASHVLGIEYPPFPIPNNAYRVFGFLKGREGESGWWVTRYPQDQNSPVDLSIVNRDDPVYREIISGGGRTSARGLPPGQRSAALQIQD